MIGKTFISSIIFTIVSFLFSFSTCTAQYRSAFIRYYENQSVEDIIHHHDVSPYPLDTAIIVRNSVKQVRGRVVEYWSYNTSNSVDSSWTYFEEFFSRTGKVEKRIIYNRRNEEVYSLEYKYDEHDNLSLITSKGEMFCGDSLIIKNAYLKGMLSSISVLDTVVSIHFEYDKNKKIIKKVTRCKPNPMLMHLFGGGCEEIGFLYVGENAEEFYFYTNKYKKISIVNRVIGRQTYMSAKSYMIDIADHKVLSYKSERDTILFSYDKKGSLINISTGHINFEFTNNEKGDRLSQKKYFKNYNGKHAELSDKIEYEYSYY